MYSLELTLSFLVLILDIHDEPALLFSSVYDTGFRQTIYVHIDFITNHRQLFSLRLISTIKGNQCAFYSISDKVIFVCLYIDTLPFLFGA